MKQINFFHQTTISSRILIKVMMLKSWYEFLFLEPWVRQNRDFIMKMDKPNLWRIFHILQWWHSLLEVVLMYVPYSYNPNIVHNPKVNVSSNPNLSVVYLLIKPKSILRSTYSKRLKWKYIFQLVDYQRHMDGVARQLYIALSIFRKVNDNMTISPS